MSCQKLDSTIDSYLNKIAYKPCNCNSDYFVQASSYHLAVFESRTRSFVWNSPNTAILTTISLILDGHRQLFPSRVTIYRKCQHRQQFEPEFVCGHCSLGRGWPHAPLQYESMEKMVDRNHSFYGFTLCVSAHSFLEIRWLILTWNTRACTSSIYSTTYDQLLHDFNCSREAVTLGLSLFIWGMGKSSGATFFVTQAVQP